MTRSTYSSRPRSSETSSRVSRFVSQFSGRPASTPAAATTRARTAFVRAASRPPFRMRALPLLTARPDIWIRASGLASKIMAMRPMGQVTRRSTRPASRLRASTMRPPGSGRRMRASRPATASLSLCSSKASLFRRASGRSSTFAAAISSLFALNISSRASPRRRDMASRASLLLILGVERRAVAAAAPAAALSRVVIRRNYQEDGRGATGRAGTRKKPY